MDHTLAAPSAVPVRARSARPSLDSKPGPATVVVFVGLLAVGLFFTAWSLYSDIADAGTVATTRLPYLLLGIALVIALGFEFVDGFHDTANAVATVIYTHSLPPNFAEGERPGARRADQRCRQRRMGRGDAPSDGALHDAGRSL